MSSREKFSRGSDSPRRPTRSDVRNFIASAVGRLRNSPERTFQRLGTQDVARRKQPRKRACLSARRCVPRRSHKTNPNFFDSLEQISPLPKICTNHIQATQSRASCWRRSLTQASIACGSVENKSNSKCQCLSWGKFFELRTFRTPAVQRICHWAINICKST